MNCKKCNKEILEDSKFCPACGSFIVSKQEKKTIFILCVLFQIIAGLSHFLLIKSIINSRIYGYNESFYIFLTTSILFQLLSIVFIKKNPREYSKAYNIVNTPKNIYGWVALGIFLLVILFMVLYVYLS